MEGKRACASAGKLHSPPPLHSRRQPPIYAVSDSATLLVHACSLHLQAKDKAAVSKYDETKGLQRLAVDDTPLDDPVAEKLRQQRLVEEADYQATLELFGKGASILP